MTTEPDQTFTLDNDGEPVEVRRVFRGGGDEDHWVVFDQETGDEVGSVRSLRVDAVTLYDGEVTWVLGPAKAYTRTRLVELQPETVVEMVEVADVGGSTEWKVGGEKERAIYELRNKMGYYITDIQTYEDLYRAMKHPERSKQVADAAWQVEDLRGQLRDATGLTDDEIEMAAEFWQVFEGDPHQTYEAIIALLD